MVWCVYSILCLSYLCGQTDSEYIYFMKSDMSPKVSCKLLSKINTPSARRISVRKI